MGNEISPYISETYNQEPSAQDDFYTATTPMQRAIFFATLADSADIKKGVIVVVYPTKKVRIHKDHITITSEYDDDHIKDKKVESWWWGDLPEKEVLEEVKRLI